MTWRAWTGWTGWLNAQRGRRRLLLLWLDAYPFGFIACAAFWAFWVFEPDALWTVLGAAAVAVAVAVPLVFVGSGLHAVRAGASAGSAARALPRLSWRRIGSMFLAAVVVALQCVVFDDLAHGRRQSADLLGNWVSVAVGAGCLGLILAEDRYARQVARRRVALKVRVPGSLD
jgi:hypothetical protein